ncbi:MAG: [FeFe] hydrogenase H-cluster radical SAM maturase HydE [Lachnospiraceae bacterium]
MTRDVDALIQKLAKYHSLSETEYAYLLDNYSVEARDKLKAYAVKQRKEIYGNYIYIRGLIEISNICKNDCYYCGIRKSNEKASRYRMSSDEIFHCCEDGYKLGFRTFVLQGGEDGYFTDDKMCDIVKIIKKQYPDCRITLSLGERSRNSYQRLFDAGADRYLLRHETHTKSHYCEMHPKEMSYEHRMECLYWLKDIGYQVGCGFMVGSPGQTNEMIARDLKFVEEFQPHMCGIGPFIPHRDTPFGNCAPGTLERTCYLLSIIRLIKPNILLPATTALGTIAKDGQEQGILSGANVIMPNLSLDKFKDKYELYNNKRYEAAKDVDDLKKRMEQIGYEVVVDQGDMAGWNRV